MNDILEIYKKHYLELDDNLFKLNANLYQIRREIKELCDQLENLDEQEIRDVYNECIKKINMMSLKEREINEIVNSINNEIELLKSKIHRMYELQ